MEAVGVLPVFTPSTANLADEVAIPPSKKSCVVLTCANAFPSEEVVNQLVPVPVAHDPHEGVDPLEIRHVFDPPIPRVDIVPVPLKYGIAPVVTPLQSFPVPPLVVDNVPATSAVPRSTAFVDDPEPINMDEVRVSDTNESVNAVPFHTPVVIVPSVVIAAHDSAFPDASTPKPYCPAEQLVPLAANAVAVEALPVTAPVNGPEKPVDVRIPVDGLNVSLVEDTF